MIEKAVRMTINSIEAGDPDIPLIRAIAQRDHGALGQLYARHGLHLLNYIIGQVGERPLAEEVLQDVMLTVWHGAGNFREESSVRTWVFAIARRKAIKARNRHLAVHAPLDGNDVSASIPIQQTETRLAEKSSLDKAMNKLPPDQQEALDLVFYRGMTGIEASQHLNIPLNTFKSRLRRAKATLRGLLLQEDE